MKIGIGPSFIYIQYKCLTEDISNYLFGASLLGECGYFLTQSLYINAAITGNINFALICNNQQQDKYGIAYNVFVLTGLGLRV